MNDIARILTAVELGQTAGAHELLPLVERELRRLVTVRTANKRPGHPLHPSELAHEAWLSLVDSKQRSWKIRAYFFSAAAEAMRRILIDRVRRKQIARRGAGPVPTAGASLARVGVTSDDQLLAVNEALGRFVALEPQKAELVKLRYFVGLRLKEAAEVLGISEVTAKRWWSYARAWLFEAVRSGSPPSAMNHQA